MRNLFLLSLCCTLSFTAHAEVTANPSRYDKRTRSVAYEPLEVYRIKGYYGYFTRLEFAPDETEIEFALGDEEAWMVVSTRNNVLLKPKRPKPDTNMVVITNKRSYNFVLTAEDIPKGDGSSRANKDEQQFLVRFTYPQEEAKERKRQQDAEAKAYAERQKKEKEALDRKLKEYQVGAALRDANNAVMNTDYFGCGAEEVLPSAAYDNHQFTYLKFPPGTEIPSIFVIDTYGDESLINYNVENDWIVIQRTAKEMTLRNGKFVGCLINANRTTNRTESGTISPSVKRTLKNDKEQQQ